MSAELTLEGALMLLRRAFAMWTGGPQATQAWLDLTDDVGDFLAAYDARGIPNPAAGPEQNLLAGPGPAVVRQSAREVAHGMTPGCPGMMPLVGRNGTTVPGLNRAHSELCDCATKAIERDRAATQVPPQPPSPTVSGTTLLERAADLLLICAEWLPLDLGVQRDLTRWRHDYEQSQAPKATPLPGHCGLCGGMVSNNGVSCSRGCPADDGRGYTCGCHETYPQLQPGKVNHGPGCPKYLPPEMSTGSRGGPSRG